MWKPHAPDQRKENQGPQGVYVQVIHHADGHDGEGYGGKDRLEEPHGDRRYKQAQHSRYLANRFEDAKFPRE